MDLHNKANQNQMRKLCWGRTQQNTNLYILMDLCTPHLDKVIKLLSDKWNHIQSGIDKDKFEKREVLEERIKIIEDLLSSEKPKDEQIFKVLKDSVLKLQDQAYNQKNRKKSIREREATTEALLKLDKNFRSF